MFTGIIQAVGTVRRIERQGGDMRLHIATGKLDMTDVQLGDSIATNGVCLTAVQLPGDGFVADVSNETLARATLEHFQVGQRVNLEKAMQPTSRFGGHIVSGHVDGLGEVLSISPDARAVRYQIKAPAALAKYIAEKGSITVDGISLTVNELNGAVFGLTIVPHTVSETNISGWGVGTRINLEVDVVARYLERLLLGEKAAEPQAAGGISLAFLAENGFLKS